MLISLTAFVLSLSSVVAQIAPAAANAPAINAPAVLNNGPCLDSPHAVPHTLDGNDRTAEVVRIDKVVSTSTMIDGHIIGYLYTRQDGTTYLGQRTDAYMSAADSSAINNVLASTHLPASNVTAFPPKTKYGVRTYYQELFVVKLTPASWADLHVRVEPCVAWPSANPLPDPMP
jgi:hypothetical protein